MFGSKNEWKRHINRLHLQLDFWRCDIEGCRDGHKDAATTTAAAAGGGGEEHTVRNFNRRDLFTQHLRRMHPQDLERCAEGTIQDRCYHVSRQPPDRGVCGFCGEGFAGEGCWDDCLEHVGKHFERLEGARQLWRDDDGLRAWMMREGLFFEQPTAATATDMGTGTATASGQAGGTVIGVVGVGGGGGKKRRRVGGS